jgi:hypothetical protein
VAPPLILAAFGLLLGVGTPPVTEWFWPAPTTNAAEAALLGDSARIRVLVADGVSLNTPMPIRPDLRDDDMPLLMSPLEAAMRGGNDEAVQLLIELGARPPGGAATAAAP